MSIKIDYYIKNTKDFPIAHFFDDIDETWQVLAKAKEVLKELITDRGVGEMRGAIKGAGPAFHNCYFVDEGTVIYNDVTIIGPVYIGKNCEIMPGAIIRPNTILSDGCSVGHGSEVKRCVMMPGSKVASLAFAGDCLLGRSARIGSGVITANRKFNQSDAAVRIDGVRYELHDSFFGCVLGDSARLGANCVPQPGTHIGPHSWVYPLTNVRGFIPAGRRVYEKRELVFEENEIIELKP